MQADVVVVGAGSIGLSIAYRLLVAGQKIIVLDSHKISQRSPRLIAVNKASADWLASVGIGLSDTMSGEAVPLMAMRVWGSGRSEKALHLSADELGVEQLGVILDNSLLQQTLLEKWMHEGGQLVDGVDFSHVVEAQEGVTLVSKQGDRYQAKLLIGADGADSWLRQQVGITCDYQPYGQSAVTAIVETEHSHEGTAWQRFMPGEVLAFLPWKGGHQCGIVWSTQPDHAKLLCDSTVLDFNKALGQAFGYQLGKVSLVSQRATFPLVMRHAKQYTQGRVALVGDAAHTLHPLAGQGGNMGFADVACLAGLLIKTAKAKGDLGSSALLRRYQRHRKPENRLMIAAMSGLKHLFCTDKGSLTALSGVGLKAVNHSVTFKRFLTAVANG